MILHALRNQWTAGFDTEMFWTNCEHSFKTEMIHNDSALHPTWFSIPFGWWCTNYGVVTCRDVFFDRKPEAEGMVTNTDCKRWGLLDYHRLGHNTRPAGCQHSAGCDWPPLTTSWCMVLQYPFEKALLHLFHCSISGKTDTASLITGHHSGQGAQW